MYLFFSYTFTVSCKLLCFILVSFLLYLDSYFNCSIINYSIMLILIFRSLLRSNSVSNRSIPFYYVLFNGMTNIFLKIRSEINIPPIKKIPKRRNSIIYYYFFPFLIRIPADYNYLLYHLGTYINTKKEVFTYAAFLSLLIGLNLSRLFFS